MNKQLARRCGSMVLSLLAFAATSPAQEPTPRAARGATSDSVQFLTWTYMDAPMGLYLPPPTGKPLPVVMFLHPCNNDPVYEGLWINAALNAIEPTAIFLPTAPVTPNTEYSCADWGGTYDAAIRPQMRNALHEFDSLIQVHEFDTTRQYLYGESMGGEGVYRLLMDFPSRFTGAVSVGGYTKNKGAAQMAKTPFWILIGVEDEYSPIDESRTIRDAILAEGGTQMKYTEFPGLRHVAAIEQVRTDSAVVGWLLRQTRSSVGIRPDRAAASRQDALFSLVDGSIRWSTNLSSDTRLSLYGTDGTLLLQTDSRTKTVTLPACLHHRVVHWKAEQAGRRWSGKMAIAP
jgi:predicted esterase